MATKKRKSNSFKKILYATDFSDASFDAFDKALLLAKKFNAKLFIIHVVDTSPQAAGFYLPHISIDNLNADMEAAASEMLSKKFKRRLAGLSSPKNYELHTVSGVPAKEILKLASKEKADLIVLGTYGRSGLDRLVFGSTTERVMRKAGSPVMAVPPA